MKAIGNKKQEVFNELILSSSIFNCICSVVNKYLQKIDIKIEKDPNIAVKNDIYPIILVTFKFNWIYTSSGFFIVLNGL